MLFVVTIMKSIKVTILCILLTVLTCVFCTGCASMKEKDRLNAFNERVRAYGKMLRWGDYAQAAAMRRAREGESAPVNTESLGEVRVTSYRITRSELASDNAMGSVSAAIEYYHERENRIRKLVDQQKWWYDDKREKWYLDGELPAFI